MQIDKLEISKEEEVLRINGRTAKEVLDSPLASMARQNNAIETVFSYIGSGKTMSEAIEWMDTQGLVTIQKIMIIQAITGWSLAQVKPFFDRVEQGLD